MVLKKALIITYYWPPSGGGGVQRWLKFAKYLRDFGWEPIIYTPKDPDFELKDDSLLDDVPEGLAVLKRPIWEPYQFYRRLLGKKAVQQQGVVSKNADSWLSKLAVWVRGNFFIPDSRVFWVRPSVNYLTRYLKTNKVDIIITTGPPHSIHLIGLELKKRLKINWLADFRDPWSQWDVLDQLNLSESARASHRKLENKVLSNSDLLITVSPRLLQSFIKLGATNASMITNGYDYEISSLSNSKPDKYRISHIGLINKGRNPTGLWRCLEKLSKEIDGFAEDLEIYLAGTIEAEVLETIKGYGDLKNNLINAGYRAHADVLQDYNKSEVLLLTINNTDNGKWILPGKMYEYMAFGKPILAFGPIDSDASEILVSAGYNKCLDYDNDEAITEFLRTSYESYKTGGGSLKSPKVEKFSRRSLTKQLVACLETLQ